MRQSALYSLLVLLSVTFTTFPAQARRHRGGVRRVPPLTADGRPNIQSAAAVVVNLDSGQELYTKNPDAVRPIASITKLFVALLVRKRGLDLNGTTTITMADRAFRHNGARSKLITGRTYRNHDILRAMLLASDNMAPSALGRAVGLSADQLVAALNAEAREMGLTHTHFADPTGLNPQNRSTPREIVVALRAALADPVIVKILTTPRLEVDSVGTPVRRSRYVNTDLLVRRGDPSVIGGKTGYTDLARYCLAIAARVAHQRIGMVFLGAEGELTRFADFHRAVEWLAKGGSPRATPAAVGVGRAAAPPPAGVISRLGSGVAAP